MNNTDQSNLLSQYRTELMGVAILWVYLFHSKIYFPDTSIFFPISFIQSIGFGGVDLFIFLSGFGLMYGMKKFSYSAALFYKKRILRIAPAYLLAVSLALLVKIYLGSDVSLSEAILKLSTAWFWIGNGRDFWYIPAIIALYLLFPLYYKLFDSASNKIKFTLISMATLYGICGLAVIFELSYFLIFLSRVPVFFLGIYVGYTSLSKIKSNNKAHTFHLFVLILSLLLLALIQFKTTLEFRRSTGFQYYPFVLVTYSLLYVTSWFMSILSNLQSKLIPPTLKTLKLLGLYSLEIYLLHVHIVFPLGQKIMNSLLFNYGALYQLNKGRILEFFIYFIFTLLFAILLKFTCSKILNISFTRVPARDFR